MPLDNARTGIGYAAEFQSSALPWVTSSLSLTASAPQRWDFGKVTRFITISNTGGGTLSFGFTRNGLTTSNNRYFLSGGQNVTMELRVKMLFIGHESGPTTYSILAGLTNVEQRYMPTLSGTMSGSFGWDGVG